MSERETIMHNDLDSDVIEAIRKGKTKLSKILGFTGAGVTERMLDSSLQRLRRAGKIRFEKGHWKL